ncbi:MAG: DNA polymerase/3'-5' exonuclease PolX [Gammaproteobacteria bacterium]|nr:DNA polymerase/3'-5' exonuclease PolX [Gammaproteobacteria bacterium]
MPASNVEIARLFNRLADLLEIDGANPFRVRAYRNAARTIRAQSRSMADRVAADEDLSALPDIGDDIAARIKTIVETDRLPVLDEIEARVPGELSDMMHIEGLGPKRVKALYQELQIAGMDDLERVARAGRIHELPGFGRKTEEAILRRVEAWTGRERRTLLAEAEGIAEPLVKYLEKSRGVKRLTIAGSYRRRKETVGDLDILATAKKGSNIIERFVDYENVGEVVSHGTTRSTVHLKSGMQVDLRVVPEVSYGAALHYFTGSKSHNIALRAMAQKRKEKVNEYGVYKGDKRIAGRTEEEVYKHFGMTWVPPELRENHGEIDAARDNRLPDLVTVKDVRGDLQMHTTESDGRNSLEEMARTAADMGYDYIAITDHSQHVTVANGLDEKRLRRQIEAIDRLNDKLEEIVVLKSLELDILEDGSLDLPDSVLKELDLTVCSIHSKFNLSRDKQTGRVLRAMDNPFFNIFAHPTGRLINERDPYDIDIERIMEGAKERGCFLEVNAQPVRLDLNDDACRMARDLGLKLAISTDAHSADGLANMRFGVNQARRGWLEADDVINTRSLTALRKLLKRA